MPTPLWLNRGGVLRRGFIQDQDVDSNANIQASKIAGVYTLLWDTQDAGVQFPVASITTPTLPQTYAGLHVVWTARSDGAANSENMLVRFNGDSTSGHWNWEFNRFVGTSVSAGESLNNNCLYCGDMTAATGEANATGGGQIWIPGYSTSTRQLVTCIAGAVVGANSGTTGFMNVTTNAGRWSQSAPITTITFFPGGGNFVQGFTRIQVYGIDG